MHHEVVVYHVQARVDTAAAVHRVRVDSLSSLLQNFARGGYTKYPGRKLEHTIRKSKNWDVGQDIKSRGASGASPFPRSRESAGWMLRT